MTTFQSVYASLAANLGGTVKQNTHKSHGSDRLVRLRRWSLLTCTIIRCYANANLQDTCCGDKKIRIEINQKNDLVLAEKFLQMDNTPAGIRQIAPRFNSFYADGCKVSGSEAVRLYRNTK